MKHNKIMRKAIAEAKAASKTTKPCPACSGSGRYDAKGSPKCDACKGTGKK